jgi:hypothetical protein
MVYYNCKTKKVNPKSIKYMLGTGWWNGILDKDKWFWIMTKPHIFIKYYTYYECTEKLFNWFCIINFII